MTAVTIDLTLSTEEEAEIVRAAGASDMALVEGFRDAVKELAAGRGVDVVVGPVGGSRFTDSLRSSAVGGRILVIGFTGGEIPTMKVNRLLLNNIDVVGAGWGAWTFSHPGYARRAVGRARASAVLRRDPRAHTRGLSLDRAAYAIAALEKRSAKSKVVVSVR